jgi:NAD-dependent SIR2 family protein deacetylase
LTDSTSATAHTDTANRAVDALAGLVARGGVLALTGAGISTDSGIPDYRGPDGQRRVTPMQHGEFVTSSSSRQRYWARSYAGWSRFTAAEPNAGHQALAALERHGLVTDIITQNVDGLHQRAGSSRVVELHGSLAEVVCLDCGQRYPREQIQAAIRQANPHFADDIIGLARDGSRVSSQIRPDGDVVLDDALIAHFVTPTCRACGLDRLKPDVVFFGGSVPRERVDQCFHLTDAAHALVVIGSSLQVMSGLRFVRRAARGGIPIAAVTRGTLRDRHLIDVQVDDGITETLRLVADNVAAGGRPSR